MSLPSVAVSRIGLTTSLGWSAVQSCAAARAGLSRASALGVTVEDEDGEEVPVLGHPVRHLTDGFSGVGRYARMCVPALEDLMGPSAGEVLPGPGVGLFLHVSDHYLPRARAEEEEHGEAFREQEQILSSRWEGQEAFTRGVKERLLPLLSGRHGFEPQDVFLSEGGSAGFVGTLELASEALARGRFQQVVVGAVDSMIETSMVEAMAALDILKTPTKSTGVAPGECAAFLLLEAPARAGPGSVLMDGLTRQRGSFHRFSQHPPLGVELAHSIGATLDATRPGSVAACIVNLNGDERRSLEFGNVMVRLTAEGIPTDFALWCPALNFGETGAATAALSICLGVRAIQRGYAPGESLLGAVLSDDGERGSFRLTRADTQAKKGSGG